MAKSFRRILCALILAFAVIFTSACSFFGGEESRQISNIYSRRGENSEGVTGTFIVIEYEGDEYEPDEFFIADAEPGEKGNGISSIESHPGEDGTSTIVTIYYTDISKAPTELTLPFGTFIVGIDTSIDPVTRAVTLTILFSDPNIEPVIVTLDAGKDGIDGDSIQDILTETDDEGNITVTIIRKTYNRETEEWETTETTFTIPKGEEGNGIKYVEVNATKTRNDPYNIYLDIYYDDNSFETITIPKANSWYTGEGEPLSTQYNIGDFYFDTLNYIIYQKETTGWKKVADFSSFSQEPHTVYFYIDNGETLSTHIQITHGYNFASAGEQVPTPAKEGYKFMGWYTEYVNPDDLAATVNPNAGHFTDLTPVLSNLNLYARWVKET